MAYFEGGECFFSFFFSFSFYIITVFDDLNTCLSEWDCIVWDGVKEGKLEGVLGGIGGYWGRGEGKGIGE